MIIQAKHISKSYHGIKALNDLSFEVEAGEIFGFIGPDGAGKTTLFRILTTLILPDQGEVNFLGLDAVKNFKEVRKRVGYMPGQFSLYSDLSVLENLNFFATVFGTTIEENYHLIRDIYTQIEPFKNRLAGKLSGGMKQKLALCCALIHQPKLLVLDEPTTGVDAVSRHEFWDLLIGLKEKNISILVSTPYMDEAGMCDRVALIQNGDILATDTPHKIVKDFGKEIFSLRTSNLYQGLKDLRVHPTTHSVFPFGQDLHFISKEDGVKLHEVKEYLTAKGHSDIHIEKISASIEDVFMHLMKKEEVSDE